MQTQAVLTFLTDANLKNLYSFFVMTPSHLIILNFGEKMFDY